MDLWADLYKRADASLRAIMEAAHFRPACEPGPGESPWVRVIALICFMHLKTRPNMRHLW